MPAVAPDAPLGHGSQAGGRRFDPGTLHQEKPRSRGAFVSLGRPLRTPDSVRGTSVARPARGRPAPRVPNRARRRCRAAQAGSCPTNSTIPSGENLDLPQLPESTSRLWPTISAQRPAARWHAPERGRPERRGWHQHGLDPVKTASAEAPRSGGRVRYSHAMDVEEATLRAFIRRERRQRYVALLSSRVKRKKLLRELDHRVEGDLDGRFAWPLWRDADSPSELYDFLRQRGAPERCHVISSVPDLDGNEMDLREALGRIPRYRNGHVDLVHSGTARLLRRRDGACVSGTARSRRLRALRFHGRRRDRRPTQPARYDAGQPDCSCGRCRGGRSGQARPGRAVARRWHAKL